MADPHRLANKIIACCSNIKKKNATDFASQKEGSNRIARTQTIHPTTDEMTGK